MHVGMAVIFQNPAQDPAVPDKGQQVSDREVYKQDLALADMAEGLGYDSIWSVEHHFTDYTMCPNPAQFLTYMAGRTKRVQLGSMVLVLPWHDPIRLAEEIAVLDHLSDGRVILGIGRGAGLVEFEGFRIPMDQSRDRFVEAAELILGGLETGICEYQGQHYQQPRAAIRPKPFKTFRGRTYAASVSPESAPIMAKLGIGMLIIPQKPWKECAKDIETYRAQFQALNGFAAPQPISSGWVFCDEDAGRAEEQATKWIGGYYRSVLEHYKFGGDHLKTTKGYEYYGKFAEKIQEKGEQEFISFFRDLQVWGTPEVCYQKIVEVQRRIDACGFVGIFSYAGMPAAEALRNYQLFTREVMPRLKKLDVGGTPDMTAADARKAAE